MRDIDTIVVHYSATYEDQNLTVADIRRMHLARNFNDVGYHWVVGRDGTVWKGRDEATIGAHVVGHNTKSIGICGIGGLNRATGPNKGVKNWTPVQEAAILKLLDEVSARYPRAKVVGHKDLAATQCPGFDVRDWWARHLWKKKAEEAAAPADPVVPALSGLTAKEVRNIVSEELAPMLDILLELREARK